MARSRPRDGRRLLRSKARATRSAPVCPHAATHKDAQHSNTRASKRRACARGARVAARSCAPKPPPARAADDSSGSGRGAGLACHVVTWIVVVGRSCNDRRAPLTMYAVRRDVGGGVKRGQGNGRRDSARLRRKRTPPLRNCVFVARPGAVWRRLGGCSRAAETG